MPRPPQFSSEADVAALQEVTRQSEGSKSTRILHGCSIPLPGALHEAPHRNSDHLDLRFCRQDADPDAGVHSDPHSRDRGVESVRARGSYGLQRQARVNDHYPL